MEYRRVLCSANIPRVADSHRFVPPVDPETRPEASDVHSVLASLVVLTMNCRGAGKKAALILSLLEDNSTDVALLQELWEALSPFDFSNSNYVVFWDGEVKRAAGLAIPVHRDFLSKWKVKGEVELGTDRLLLTLAHSSAFRIVFVNIYLRPGVTYAVWADAKKYLLSLKPTLRSSAIFLGGDLMSPWAPRTGRFGPPSLRGGCCIS